MDCSRSEAPGVASREPVTCANRNRLNSAKTNELIPGAFLYSGSRMYLKKYFSMNILRVSCEISLHFVDTLSIDTTIGIMLMGFETNLKTYTEAVRYSVEVDTYPVLVNVFEQSTINYIH